MRLFFNPLRILLALVPIVFLIMFIMEYRRIWYYPANAWTEDIKGDCGIVLTGGPGRIREGIDMLSHDLIKHLIISGVHPKAQLREIFPQLPYYPEIKDQNVILERRSRTTYGNVYQSLSIAEALKCRNLVLVTSKIHMYRAKRTFAAALPEGITLSEKSTIAGSYEPEFSEAFFETFKSLFYSLWAY